MTCFSLSLRVFISNDTFSSKIHRHCSLVAFSMLFRHHFRGVSLFDHSSSGRWSFHRPFALCLHTHFCLLNRKRSAGVEREPARRAGQIMMFSSVAAVSDVRLFWIRERLLPTGRIDSGERPSGHVTQKIGDLSLHSERCSRVRTVFPSESITKRTTNRLCEN